MIHLGPRLPGEDTDEARLSRALRLALDATPGSSDKTISLPPGEYRLRARPGARAIFVFHEEDEWKLDGVRIVGRPRSTEARVDERPGRGVRFVVEPEDAAGGRVAAERLRVFSFDRLTRFGLESVSFRGPVESLVEVRTRCRDLLLRDVEVDGFVGPAVALRLPLGGEGIRIEHCTFRSPTGGGRGAEPAGVLVHVPMLPDRFGARVRGVRLVGCRFENLHSAGATRAFGVVIGHEVEDVELEACTFTNAELLPRWPDAQRGGGVLLGPASARNVRLRECHFHGVHSELRGRAIRLLGCTFEDAGMRVQSRGTVLESCRFELLRAVDRSVIHLQGCSDCVVRGSVFTALVPAAPGVGWVEVAGPSRGIAVLENLFRGLAMHVRMHHPAIRDCRVEDNVCDVRVPADEGGANAIHCHEAATGMSFRNNTVLLPLDTPLHRLASPFSRDVWGKGFRGNRIYLQAIDAGTWTRVLKDSMPSGRR